jgi:fructose-specific phosphotransferase system IIC component
MKKFLEEAKTHLMTGVSYMLPFVVAGGLLLTIGLLLGGGDNGHGTAFAKQTVKVGVLIFSLMVPVMAGYMSYSIADRPGIAPGMVGGLIAHEIGAGFLGGIVAGFIAGYIVNFIKKLPMHSYLAALKPIIVIPLFKCWGCCFNHVYHWSANRLGFQRFRRLVNIIKRWKFSITWINYRRDDGF